MKLFRRTNVVVVVDFKAKCQLVGFGPTRGVPSAWVFGRDPSPYLREFRRKPRQILVDKRCRGLNLIPPVYQL